METDVLIAIISGAALILAAIVRIMFPKLFSIKKKFDKNLEAKRKLSSTLDDTYNKLSQYMEEIMLLKEEKQTMEFDMNQMLRTEAECQDEIQNYRNLVEQLKREKVELESMLDEAQDKYYEIQVRYEELRKEVDDYKKKNFLLNKEKENLIAKIKKLENEIKNI